MESTRSLDRPHLVALIALGVLALVLRTSGAWHMLPCLTEPDAHIVEQVELHRAPDPAVYYGSKAYGKYPHLLSRVLQLLPEPAPAPDGPLRAADLPEHLRAVSAPYVRGRLLVAVLSALMVPLTWALARRFLAPGAALLAAGFVATSLLHLDFSWQARPHGALATLTTAALLALFRLRARPSLGSYAAAGALIALAIGCLHSGVLILPAAVTAHFLAKRSGSANRHHALLLVPLALIAAAVWAFYPFLLGAPGGVQTVSGGFVQAGHRFDLGSLSGGGFAAMARDLWWHDPTLLAAVVPGALIAAVLALRGGARRLVAGPSDERDELWILAAWALPYFVVLGLFDKTYERFQLPLIPLYAMLAALLVCKSARALAKRTRLTSRAAFALLAALALALPSYAAVRLALLARTPDTAHLTARWIEEHVEPDARILVQPEISLPLLLAPAGLPAELDADSSRRQPWLHHVRLRGIAAGEPVRDLLTIPWRELEATGQVAGMAKDDPRRVAAIREMLIALDGDYAVLEIGAGTKPLTGVPEGVLFLGERIARISPMGLDSADDDGLRPRLNRGHEDEHLFLRAMRARHWGPAYDVIRLRSRKR